MDLVPGFREALGPKPSGLAHVAPALGRGFAFDPGGVVDIDDVKFKVPVKAVDALERRQGLEKLHGEARLFSYLPADAVGDGLAHTELPAGTDPATFPESTPLRHVLHQEKLVGGVEYDGPDGNDDVPGVVHGLATGPRRATPP